MKKKFLLLFLILALALTAAGTAISACAENAPEEPRQSAPAENVPEENAPNVKPMPRGSETHRSCVSVTGSGKVTVPADAAQMSFRIRVLSDSFSEGQKRMNELKKALFDAVCGVCEATGDNTPCGDSHRPVSDGSVGGYEFMSVVCVKITDVPKTEEVINAAVSAGATHVYTYYLLENDTDAAKQALTLAKEDAAAKAAALIGDEAEFVRLREECCWHGSSDEAGKVTVYANVRAKYAAQTPQI